MFLGLSSRIFPVAVVAVCGGLGCVAGADEPSGSDEEMSVSLEANGAAAAIRDPSGEEQQGCGLHKNQLELVRAAITRDALLVEVRFHAGSEGAVQHERSAPRVALLRDGCAAAAPAVDGVVEAASERGSMLRVPLAGLPEGRLDLSFTVEGAEIVLLLRKEATRVVLETDAQRYPDGNTEIGGAAQPCGRIQ